MAGMGEYGPLLEFPARRARHDTNSLVPLNDEIDTLIPVLRLSHARAAF